jgi:hypothetical protein
LKPSPLLTLALFTLLAATTAVSRAAIVYSGIRDFPIPFDLEGSYLQLESDTTTSTLPANWSTAPWINPFFGGVKIATSPLLRPIVTGSTQVLNLPLGTVINSTSQFTLGESGSDTHFGPATGQFALNVPGYLGVAFRSTITSPDSYGWIQLQVSNLGAGKIIAWAYENLPATPIAAGATGIVPEPATFTLFALTSLTLLALRRRAYHS